jgi:hypothetical protein
MRDMISVYHISKRAPLAQWPSGSDAGTTHRRHATLPCCLGPDVIEHIMNIKPKTDPCHDPSAAT